MSSVAGVKGFPGAGVYVASKHGVLGLTKVAALEYAAAGIRVNAVCPAVIETPMADRAFNDPEMIKRVRAQHPLGRFGKPAEVGEAVLWLSSDKSSFTTGQFIAIDGGLLTGADPNA
jgi:NAD(P)-dependent dehydrogenase (short-subunit alcohol dehydrogenase family)